MKEQCSYMQKINYIFENLIFLKKICPRPPQGGFPLGEIFQPNRNFLLSYKHSDGTNQKSFEFEQ
jgi:hypothetical protein